VRSRATSEGRSVQSRDMVVGGDVRSWSLLDAAHRASQVAVSVITMKIEILTQRGDRDLSSGWARGEGASTLIA
jgi:hypothetical protein